jgi:hypothetical protein
MFNKRDFIKKKKEFIKKINQFIERKNKFISKKNTIIEKNLLVIKKQILNNFTSNNNFVVDNTKNTVLLIEPRFKEKETLYLLANMYNKLGNSWNYVFYCGKSYKSIWENKLPNFIELRSLEHDNFDNTKLYSDFCKQKELWESLYGDYILTIQLDTWVMNHSPYDISYFIRLNKSYIGGNMEYKWSYFNKLNLQHTYRNFNGGLSLRKKKDMIKIIETYPPIKTLDNCADFLSEHEDVYFTMGCIKLKLPIGDDEASSHFSLHTIFHEKYFGIHQPSAEVKKKINITNPYLKFLNVNLHL